MTILRVPQEANPSRKSLGVTLVNSLDFNKLRNEKSNDGVLYPKRSKEIIKSHIEECICNGLKLTTLGNNNDNDTEEAYNKWKHIKTKVFPIITPGGQHYEVEIRVESIDIAGTPHVDIKGVRHIAKLRSSRSNNGANIDPSYLFDVYNRINYTDAIDKYAFLVEQVDPLQEFISPQPTTKGGEKDDDDDIRWCQVAYAADKILPFFSVRDFVTFDFVSEKNMMFTSRSCQHPLKPRTSPPTVCGFCHTRSSSSSSSSPRPTYRVPVMYYLRVLPTPTHVEEENTTIVVQFQYSDVGGFIPPKEQTKAVVQFGIDSLSNMFTIALTAKENGVLLGRSSSSSSSKSNNYLSNPLDPSWRQSVNEMIPFN